MDTHFEKHVNLQGEFGDITKDEYLKRAQKHVNLKAGDNILIKTRSNGDTMIYNKHTNEFGVIDKKRNIKTYFKPSDGLEYFKRQR